VLADQPITVPPSLNGVQPGGRLDLAVVCVAPHRLHEALGELKPHRPRFVILLAHKIATADPDEDRAYCRAWGHLNDCSVLGPRAFGLQRPHLQLNLSHMSRPALAGRVAL